MSDREPAVDAARTLQWAEIAGLIDIRPDGSWHPTALGKAQLLRLEREHARLSEVITH
jgi:hypothetical protein